MNGKHSGSLGFGAVLASGVLLAAIVFAATAPAESPHAIAPMTFRVTAPATTPPGDPVFIAGDFQGWNPGDPTCQLADLGGQVHEITLDLTVGTTIQYKFTRGDWGKVEKGPSGEEIANRFHAVTGAATLELAVANWADLPANSTITGDVTTHTVPGFLSGRRVWVYLPPDYHEDTERRYPVLYMLDGQNVFDAATSFAGEWHVDETCEALIAAGTMAPIIVVAVDNGGLARIDEYTPWFDAGHGDGGGGEAHLQAIIGVLKPWVDATYRTRTGPRNTGLAGSSLGGLLPLYAVYAHPDVFGRIGALSPAIWWSDDELLDFAGAQPKPAAKVYLDMGALEYMEDADANGVDDGIDDLRAMRDLMLGQGFVLDGDLGVVEDAAGQHNEWYWAQRFPAALRFLFPPSSETPVLLAAFTAVTAQEGVEIVWRVRDLPPGSGFRLEARGNGAAYEVPFAAEPDGSFLAVDRRFRACAGCATTYALHLCPADGPCELLAEREVAGGPAGSPDLLSVSPNPFNASVEVRFELPRAQVARVSVHDLGGRLVAVLHEGPASAGPHVLRWNGLDLQGRPVAAGSYLVTLQAGPTREARVITLLP